MSLIQAIFLGFVQGVTEFLPVSSSGHLAILQNIFGMETDGGLLFDVMLHVGTLFTVCLVYRKDIWKMIRETIFMIRFLKTSVLTKLCGTAESYITITGSLCSW